MVIVDRKLDLEMPVGSMATDVDLDDWADVKVVGRARTARDGGTEMQFEAEDGVEFWDLAKFYLPA